MAGSPRLLAGKPPYHVGLGQIVRNLVILRGIWKAVFDPGKGGH
jgi:hypothetical protein